MFINRPLQQERKQDGLKVSGMCVCRSKTHHVLSCFRVCFVEFTGELNTRSSISHSVFLSCFHVNNLKCICSHREKNEACEDQKCSASSCSQHQRREKLIQEKHRIQVNKNTHFYKGPDSLMGMWLNVFLFFYRRRCVIFRGDWRSFRSRTELWRCSWRWRRGGRRRTCSCWKTVMRLSWGWWVERWTTWWHVNIALRSAHLHHQRSSGEVKRCVPTRSVAMSLDGRWDLLWIAPHKFPMLFTMVLTWHFFSDSFRHFFCNYGTFF